MAWFLSRFKRSGSKTWCHLTASSDKELARAAKVLRVKIHGKGRQRPHLDLNPKQARRARKRGAVEEW